MCGVCSAFFFVVCVCVCVYVRVLCIYKQVLCTCMVRSVSVNFACSSTTTQSIWYQKKNKKQGIVEDEGVPRTVVPLLPCPTTHEHRSPLLSPHILAKT